MFFIIAISGMTGSGKTTLTRNIASQIDDMAIQAQLSDSTRL